ncbi:MAG: hypothetical protein IPN34_10020 [Planctomycetes bacterium]|nr:hypothetical protein [Planctomycetota bacterium]
MPIVRFRRLQLLAFALAPLCGGALAAQEEIVETWPDGTVRERYQLDAEARRTGASFEYHENGQLARKAHWKADVLHGAVLEHDAKGQTLLSCAYKDGELHGDYSSWDPDSDEREKAHYTSGKLDGKRTIRRGKEELSRQRWELGVLLDLDGIAPFPRTPEQIAQGLAAIAALPVPPAEPADDALWPERIAALRRLQQYRFLCFVPHEEMALVPEWNRACDKGSELCKAIGHLDHTPPNPGWPEEEYRLGYEGTSHANLSVGSSLVGSVDAYMDDSDPSNIDRVGHRRWCLNPRMLKTGFGLAAPFSAMWSMDSSRGGAKVEAVCYPPAGYVPRSMFHARHAWSCAPPPGLFGRMTKRNIEVAIYPLDERYVRSPDPLPLDYFGVAGGGFGTGDCLIFRPASLGTAPGNRYWVELREKDEARPKALRYVVEFVELKPE